MDGTSVRTSVNPQILRAFRDIFSVMDVSFVVSDHMGLEPGSEVSSSWHDWVLLCKLPLLPWHFTPISQHSHLPFSPLPPQLPHHPPFRPSLLLSSFLIEWLLHTDETSISDEACPGFSFKIHDTSSGFFSHQNRYCTYLSQSYILPLPCQSINQVKRPVATASGTGHIRRTRAAPANHQPLPYIPPTPAVGSLRPR